LEENGSEKGGGVIKFKKATIFAQLLYNRDKWQIITFYWLRETHRMYSNKFGYNIKQLKVKPKKGSDDKFVKKIKIKYF
jgi:hypothetical protein